MLAMCVHSVPLKRIAQGRQQRQFRMVNIRQLVTINHSLVLGFWYAVKVESLILLAAKQENTTVRLEYVKIAIQLLNTVLMALMN